MSQLYEYQKRRNGGKTIGHFHKACKEDLVIMMEFLNFWEIISFIDKLIEKLDEERTANPEDEHLFADNAALKKQLVEANAIFLKDKKMVVDEIYKTFDAIADTFYSKWQESPELVEPIIESFRKKAQKRGYKEPD